MESDAPHVVLLDLGLPGMHGVDFLHQLRVRGLNPGLLIISAASSAQTDRQVMELGADEVLAKPVNPNSLIPLIEAMLSR